MILPIYRNTEKRANAYIHTYICQPITTTCKRILVLALSMQNATASVSLQVLHEPRLYQNYRRNLLAIQSSLDSTNKRQCSHIHEFLEEGCAALSYNTLLPFSLLLSGDTCDFVIWDTLTCTYVFCVYMWFSLLFWDLASGRDLSTSMLPFLVNMDCLLHFMLACSDVPMADYLKSILKIILNLYWNLLS